MKKNNEPLNRVREALDRQCENMAFVLNNMDVPIEWYKKFVKELHKDREALTDLTAYIEAVEQDREAGFVMVPRKLRHDMAIAIDGSPVASMMMMAKVQPPEVAYEVLWDYVLTAAPKSAVEKLLGDG